MTTNIFVALVVSLFLTLIFETGFYLLVARLLSYKPLIEQFSRKDLILVLCVNIITNPVVVLLYWIAAAYLPITPIFALIVLELSAIAVEGYYYQRYGSGFVRPYLFAFIVNALSCGFGVLLSLLM
ncbi:MAG: hypothetical protein LBI64_02080 [Coriobacteriales bacterium]|jgi:hypothetical protein|nr:hypothetical protein [Coriobacteriales bacterium]